MNDFPTQDEVDAILLEVGRALNNFNLVERAIETLFSALSDLNDIRGGVIMASIISIDARLKVCDGMTKVGPLPSDLDVIWRQLKNKTISLQKKRHHLAHFLVVRKTIGKGRPVLGIEPYSSVGGMSLDQGKRTHLTIRDIIQRREDFDELSKAINWLAQEVNSARGQLAPSAEFLLPEPNLVRALRNSSSHSH